MKKLSKKLSKNIAMVIFSLSAASPSISVFAAEIGSKTIENETFDGQNLLFIGDGPIASNITFDYVINKSLDSSIELTLETDIVDEINKATSMYRNKRIAFVHDGQVFFAQNSQKDLIGDKVKMKFNSISDALNVDNTLSTN
jgi:hypothetical protein